MPISEGVGRCLVVGFGNDPHIANSIPCLVSSGYGVELECDLETVHFLACNSPDDSYFHDRKHHNLHEHFDLLHWPTTEFQFCYLRFGAQVDDVVSPLYDSG